MKNFFKENTKSDIDPKLDALIKASAKYEVGNFKCYNFWENPYGFKDIGKDYDVVSKIRKEPNQSHLYNFKALGGSGETEWNHNYITGTSIAVMYYKFSTHASMDLKENSDLQLLTGDEINLIKDLVDQAEAEWFLIYKETKEYKLQQQLNQE